jgi:hypothetical protein
MKYCGDFEMWYKLTREKHAGLSGKYLIKLRNHSGQLSRNLEWAYFKLKENLVIYQYFLDKLPLEKKKYGIRALLWKIYPQYFHQFLFILKKGKLKLALKYFLFLREYDNILLLAFRWLTMMLLKSCKQDQKFYQKFFISKF